LQGLIRQSIFIAVISTLPLNAQTACATNGALAGSGSSKTFGFYNPGQPPPQRSPVSIGTQPRLPVMSPTELASVKAANAPFVNSYFPAAPSVQVQPTVIPRAPGTNTPPIVSAPTVNFSGITEPFIQFNPPSPDVAVGPSDIVMVVNESIAQFSKTGAAGPAISFQDFFGSLLPTICPTQC